jgi:hypothetical protein
VPVQHIDASAALNSGLSAACITRHLLLSFVAEQSKSLRNFDVADLKQMHFP